MNRLPPAPGTNGAAASRRRLLGFGAGAALAAWATGTAAAPVRTSGTARKASGDAIAVRDAALPARLAADDVVGLIDRQFTLPLGAEVEIDAAAGTIRMLAPAAR